MNRYASLAGLSLNIDAYRLRGLSLQATPQFERHTTLVSLEGRGRRGVGEDVTYDVQAQAELQQAGAAWPLAGAYTLDSFSRRLDDFDLFPKTPSQPGYRDYRRWAFESAALDLALRQNEQTLERSLGLELCPLRFVSSMGLGDPPDPTTLPGWLELYPGLGFKLDVGQQWDEPLVARLAATGAVEVVDLKGAYKGTPVDLEPEPALYACVLAGLPAAWVEDPAWTPGTEPLLEPNRERITWDAPIHSVEDIRGLRFKPRMINIKPSRFGRLSELMAAYDYCREEGIAMYGGGQWELGAGRDQIQHLAALFHPEGPNDVAPRGFNASKPTAGLPASPLAPPPAAGGFGWSDD